MDLFSLGSVAPPSIRGIPQPQGSVAPNSQQVRAETAAADAVTPTSGLDVGMKTVTPGAGVPIVFCREVDGIGGCWVSPPCVQYGFSVDAFDNVDISYTLVLGQGEYPAVPIADVYYGTALFGSLVDNDILLVYEGLPYNVITQTAVDPSSSLVGELPTENGGGGTFQDVTLLGCYARLPAPAVWNRQIHVFMRNGIEVDRYVEGTKGPSNNFADLFKYLLTATGELSGGLIDDDSLEIAARFLNAESLRFSGVLAGSSSLQEYLSRTAPLFLTIYTINRGRHGLMPALPVTDTYELSTAFVQPTHSYTTADLVPGTLNVQYVPASDRKPFQAVMAWRDPLIPGQVVQTTVNYSGRAVSGPFEPYDLSGFCVTQEQAIKIGRYILAQRLYVGHSLQFQLLPSVTPPIVGDLFSLERDIMPNGASVRREQFVYRVTALGIAADGAVNVTAVHFPRDASGVSQVAREIVSSPTLDAQVPEDWNELPAYDGAVPPAVVGNPDYVVATGGEIYYSGDYKIHVFHKGFLAGQFLNAPPISGAYLEDRPAARPGLVQYIEFPSAGDGTFLFRTIGGNGASVILTGTTASVDDYAATLIAAATATSDPRGHFRIVSSPPGGTIEYLIVAGGGTALSPGNAGFTPGGGGSVTTGTIAATPGYYYCHVGESGFAWRTSISNVIEYRGFTDKAFSASRLSYSPDSYTSGLGLIASAQGGANAFTGTYPSFSSDGQSGAGFTRGSASGSTMGGAGGAGGNGANAVSSTVGGAGGAGITSSILGFPVTFGRGGGGGVGNTSVSTPTAGASGVTPGCGGGGVNGNQIPYGTYDTPGIMGRNGLIVIRYRYQN